VQNGTDLSVESLMAGSYRVLRHTLAVEDIVRCAFLPASLPDNNINFECRINLKRAVTKY